MTGSTYNPQSWQDVESQNVKTDAKGVSASCPANTVTNVDLVLTDDELIRGIEFYATGQIFGDTVTLQVIDTNGVTGAPPGTVLATPVSSWNIPADQALSMKYEAIAPMKALATFTIRAIFTSTGLLNAVKVGVNYLMLQPKI